MSGRAVNGSDAVDEFDRGRRRGELESVECGAVAASDHDDVTPREVIGSRLDLIGHVAAEGTIGGSRQDLRDRSGGDEQRPGVKAHAPGLHPAGTEDRPRSLRVP